MPCRGSSRANPPGCSLQADILAHVSQRRLLVDVQHSTHGHCFAVMQLRPSTDNGVGGVPSVKMQCESKDAINVIRFFWSVEFLWRISVPSLPARHAHHCKAELPVVHRRAVNVHQECNTNTIR